MAEFDLQAIREHITQDTFSAFNSKEQYDQCQIDREQLVAEITRLRTPMECGHAGANRGEDGLCVVCAELQLIVPRKLPSIAEMTGSDPDFTGELSTAEYIREIRGEYED